MDRGFNVFLEYEIESDQLTPTGKIKRLIVDVYAMKDDREIIVEIGLLCGIDRLKNLRKARPKAQILHYPLWKNFMQYDIDRAIVNAWLERLFNRQEAVEKMGKTLGQK